MLILLDHFEDHIMILSVAPILDQFFHEPRSSAFTAHALHDTHRREATGPTAAGDECETSRLLIGDQDAAGREVHAVLAEHRQELYQAVSYTHLTLPTS